MLYRLFLCFVLFSFSHSLFANTQIADLYDKALGPHIKEGFVNYAEINKDDLNTLVEKVASYSVKDGSNQNLKDKLLAFYINAYNILTIKGITDGYGPHSLLSRYRFFKANDYVVAGTEMNLDTLEHKVIRPLNEPRIHFALVCAAIDCPPLRSEAYRASLLNQQLDDQALIFINNKDKNNFDISINEAQISSIFKWFEEDFLLQTDTLSEYIAFYVKDETLKDKLKNNELEVIFKKYDWSLNGTR